MSNESERAVLEKYKAAKKDLDAADDELFKHFEPLLMEAVKKGSHDVKDVNDILQRVPESFARFRLWRMLGHG